MNFIESFNSAIKSLKGNRARSFLTMLGIIIGISSVITMSAIGKGGQKNITGKLKENGYGKFTVYADMKDENFRWKYLFEDEMIEKLKATNEFKNISPKITQRIYSKIKDRFEIVWLTVATPEYQKIDKVNFLYGRDFISFEYNSGEKIVIIDNITAKDIFGSPQNALGKNIRLALTRKDPEIDYRIVGVFENNFEDYVKAMGGKRIPRFARFPLSTYERLYDNASNYSSIVVESKDPSKASEDMAKMKNILENITGVSDLYEVKALSDGAASFDNILSTLNLFVTFVAGISLFVGGVGVMNIMLVSVIERTKEIGIRKAIGATNKDIMFQFLIESIILTGLGGVLGIILGFILGNIIGKIVNIPPLFSITSMVISLIVSMGIGIIFGVIPAKKAAELNPIEALRSE
ncbi:ABC transporter permease [Fusobacterium perfoetens]|uniref:ABC transporter permease n=1 Tax=Fusobacterium perfoetens TaxID=852 RepID=UPI00047FD834|nr:ABC transporter permease [Fusobacterium perfoetens]